MNNDFLTRKECTAMRGIAILAIMLHNYCHFIGHVVQENEYLFFVSNNERLWQVLTHPDTLLPVHLLSYFGHYGVPVFLFLSGFGLVMKYEKTSPNPSNPIPDPSQREGSLTGFIRYHYLKLLRMLIVGFTLFLIVDVLTPGRFHYQWDHVIAQLLMYINILPEPNKIIWPGIYWFFGLMIELYIVYRLFVFRRQSWVVGILVAVCLLLQMCCDPESETLNRLRYNFIGGMLPFGAGILMGRNIGRFQFSIPRWTWALTAVAAAALVVTLGFQYYAWFWIPLFIIIGTIALVKAIPQWLMSPIVWVGGISAAIFVTHPIARKLFIQVAWRQDAYDGLMLYFVVAIALSWAVKKVIDQIPRPQ